MDQEEYGITDPIQQKDYLSTIHKNAKRLESIISDLLDLSRVQSGQLVQLQKTPCNLNELINTVASHYQKEIADGCFKIDTPENPIDFTADSGKLEQTLHNLISNAIKFSPQDSPIKLTCQVIENQIQISVADKGIGMTQEQVKKVFDKFYRVDASNTAEQGLGLGMSIVKNIVETHQGEVRVESEPGEGTTVSFSIPLPGRT